MTEAAGFSPVSAGGTFPAWPCEAACRRNADLRSAVSRTSSLHAVQRSPAAEREPERLCEREAGRPQACDTADRRSALRPRGASTGARVRSSEDRRILVEAALLPGNRLVDLGRQFPGFLFGERAGYLGFASGDLGADDRRRIQMPVHHDGEALVQVFFGDRGE